MGVGWGLCVVLLGLLVQVSGRRIFDLTHTYDIDAPQYPIAGLGISIDTYYNVTTLFEGWYQNDFWLALRKVEFYEHQGTHIDAPLHFGAQRQTLEAIPAQRLIGPGVIIDVRDKVKDNPDYAVSVQDIVDHEDTYGRIPDDAIVVMNSGWGLYYPDSKLVFGTQDITNSSTFHFPGFSLEACEFLLRDRQLGVLGVDTPSTDPAQASTFHCHIYLQSNDVPLLEYVANLDTIPPRNTTIIIGASKRRGGTGGQARLLAFKDEDTTDTSRASINGLSLMCSLVAVVFGCYAKTQI